MDDLSDVRIGIVGTGAIGGAVIDRLLNGADTPPANIVACEIDEAKGAQVSKRFGVKVSADPCDAADAQLIVLAVPPPAVPTVLAAIQDRLPHHPVIVSFAAALPLSRLESILPEKTPALRVNPNSPSLVGEGFNPVTYGSNVIGDARSLAQSFLSLLGTSIEVPDDQMNLYTALTAVGPTYFLPVLDAVIAAGIEGGLSHEAAVTAACATAQGTAAMVAKRSESPEELKLYTGLRPLNHEEVRDTVQAAAQDAFDRMIGVQVKLTG